MYFGLIVFSWIILLIFLKRTKIYFFVFLVGSVGLFCLLMYLGSGFLESYLQYFVAYAMYLAGNFFNLFSVYPKYFMITVYHDLQAVSFFVDYECSGFIETLVYVSLLAFYPIYGLVGKIKLGLIGIIYIFLSNILRIFLICVLVKEFGPSLFFFSHTIFGRILFFILMLVLYYNVFTRPHVVKQKVGNLSNVVF
jgi:exosortase family protein XrtG